MVQARRRDTRAPAAVAGLKEEASERARWRRADHAAGRPPQGDHRREAAASRAAGGLVTSVSPKEPRDTPPKEKEP